MDTSVSNTPSISGYSCHSVILVTEEGKVPSMFSLGPSKTVGGYFYGRCGDDFLLAALVRS